MLNALPTLGATAALQIHAPANPDDGTAGFAGVLQQAKAQLPPRAARLDEHGSASGQSGVPANDDDSGSRTIDRKAVAGDDDAETPTSVDPLAMPSGILPALQPTPPALGPSSVGLPDTGMSSMTDRMGESMLAEATARSTTDPTATAHAAGPADAESPFTWHGIGLVGLRPAAVAAAAATMEPAAMAAATCGNPSGPDGVRAPGDATNVAETASPSIADADAAGLAPEAKAKVKGGQPSAGQTRANGWEAIGARHGLPASQPAPAGWSSSGSTAGAVDAPGSGTAALETSRAGAAASGTAADGPRPGPLSAATASAFGTAADFAATLTRTMDGATNTGPTPMRAEAHVAAHVASAEFGPALGMTLSGLARNGIQEARLQLHPAELGPITVQIALDGTGARIDFQSDLAQTRQAIESSLPALASALRESGLTLTGGGVFQQPQGRPSDQGAAGGNGSSGARRPKDRMESTEPIRPAITRRSLVDLVA